MISQPVERGLTGQSRFSAAAGACEGEQTRRAQEFGDFAPLTGAADETRQGSSQVVWRRCRPGRRCRGRQRLFEEPAIEGGGFEARLDGQFASQDLSARFIGSHHAGAIAAQAMEPHDRLVRGLVERVRLQPTLGETDGLVRVARRSQAIDELIECLQQALPQPVPFGHDPIGITGREQVAAIQLDGSLERACLLVGQVQRELVGMINAHGPLAVGLSGEDAGLFTARRTGTVVDGEEVDLGNVGEVAQVRPEAVLDLVEAGRIPVISSVAPDPAGVIHNVNADTAASALAIALGAEKLLVLTDVVGLYRDFGNSDEVIAEISPEDLAELLPSLDAGMRPKMRACYEAVVGGVARATVVDGREEHAVLLEIFTDEGVGTQVLPGVALKVRTDG